MSTVISPSPAFLCGTEAGNLYLVSADCTTAILISEADYEVFVFNNYPVYEISESLIRSLKTVGGTSS